jgi:hypothetical protein
VRRPPFVRFVAVSLVQQSRHEVEHEALFCRAFLIVAHDAGSGKSFFVDLCATITTGRICPVFTASRSPEEMEKRLGAMPLEGGTVRSIDNS